MHLSYINYIYTCLMHVSVTFTCFRGGVGCTPSGWLPWKTLSGYTQLPRNKFTSFSHSIDWSSTYIKDLDRFDFISLGVSHHKSLILTLAASQDLFLVHALVFNPKPSVSPEAKEAYVRPCRATTSWWQSQLYKGSQQTELQALKLQYLESTAHPSAFLSKPKTRRRNSIPRRSSAEDAFPILRT